MLRTGPDAWASALGQDPAHGRPVSRSRCHTRGRYVGKPHRGQNDPGVAPLALVDQLSLDFAQQPDNPIPKDENHPAYRSFDAALLHMPTTPTSQA